MMVGEPKLDTDRLPVIVGVGQVTLRDQTWPDIQEPLDLMVEATRRAVADTGVAVLSHVDRLRVSPVFCWEYRNICDLVRARLGLDGIDAGLLEIGGNSPQRGVADAAEALQRGEIEMALICGGECMAAKKAIEAAGCEVAWTVSDNPLPENTERTLLHPFELARQAMLPIHIYPLFEPALRVSAGRTPEEHVAYLGRLMASFTEVAATNPHAWFRQRRTPEELVTPSETNRMISTPYTVRLNSFMGVDQAAAVIVTTVGTARRLGIKADRFVYVWAAGDCNDVWWFSEHVAYDTSPAMQVCARAVLDDAGVGVDDVACFDLYSCNASVVQLTAAALGLRPDDTRPRTVTGGLPYAGGPWNNYVTHAIAAMTERLRNSSDLGIITGNGGFLTKHAFGLYGGKPPSAPFRRNDRAADQAKIDALEHPRLEEEPSGPGTIEGYTVPFRRDGQPERVLALVRLDPARRTLVNSWDPSVCAAFLEGEWFGHKVQVHKDCTFALA
jgi:acetyl-CoA C-acetyltransferase